jgi:HipA-like protein
MTELVAILDGRETGRDVRHSRGRLTSTYNEAWRAATDAYPLSLSIPLALAEHGHAKIDPYLWGHLTTKPCSTSGRENSMSLPGTPSGSSLASAKTAPELCSSYVLRGSRPSWERPFHRSNSLTILPLRSVWALCARTNPRGAFQATPASLALPGYKRKPPFFLKTADGVCLPGACPPLIFLSRPQATSTATPRMNISA